MTAWLPARMPELGWFDDGPLDGYELLIASRHQVVVPASAGPDGLDFARARREMRAAVEAYEREHRRWWS